MVSIVFLLMCGCQSKEAPAVPELLLPAGVAEDTAVVTRRDIEVSIYLYARLRPEEYEMKFGNTYLAVDKVTVTYGQKVKKGDVLIRLDTKDIQKNIDDLTKQLNQVITQYEYDDADRQTDIDAAQIELDNSSAEGADLRVQKLYLEKQELVDEQVKKAEEDDISRRQQDIDHLTQLRDNAELLSESDGTVVNILVSPGDYVKPFQTGVIIAGDSSIFAEYTGRASSSDLSFMKSITAHIGGADYEMEYVPMPISQQITYIFNNLTPPSKFVFKDTAAAAALSAGETAELHCVRNISGNTLAVPVNAVYSDRSGSRYVYVQKTDSAGNTVKALAQVKTGISNESVTEITEGLNEGDIVYVKP